MTNCPICGRNDADSDAHHSRGDFKQYSCPRCGHFLITGSALAMLPARLEIDPARMRSRLSHAIRVASASSGSPMINSINLDDLIKQPLPSIERQQLNLLHWAAHELQDDRLGSVELPPSDNLAGIIGTLDGDRVDELIGLARKDGLVELVPDDCMSITPQGWLKLERPKYLSTHPIASPMTNSDASTELVKAHCNKCGPERKAYKRATHCVSGSDGEVSWSDTFDVLECCGCESICVRHQHWFSEWDSIDEDGFGRPRMNPGIETNYWPHPSRRPKPDWCEKISDENMRTLMDELYTALNCGLLIMSTTGARTLFDRASFLQVGDPLGGFAGKLKAMVEAGHISASERSILEAMTDAGNASVHRGFAPSFEQLTSIVDIVENYVERAFVLSAAAVELKKATPIRPRPPR